MSTRGARPEDVERLAAERQIVTRVQAELQREAFFHHGSPAGQHPRGGFGRLGFRVAVERIVAFNGTHLREPLAARARESRHRGEADFTGPFGGG